jgi:hypothetical protein
MTGMASLLRAIAASLVLALGCGTSGATLFGATLNTAIGVGAAAGSRAQGGCYATCTAGSTCNPASGMCERVPCGGECPPGESCEDSPTGQRCIALLPMPPEE